MTFVRVSARSDVGNVRSLNEDRIVVGERIWAVADGMGGHAAGDVASAIVQRELRALDRADLVTEDILAGIERANADIVQYAIDYPECAGLGTTVSGIAEVAIGGAHHWAIFNVGDSRVYRWFAGQLSRATVDHSEVEELVFAGQISEAEAKTHPLRNVITRSVGTRPAPAVDLWVLPQSARERFLVCSDGLTGELEDEDIARVLGEVPVDAAAGLLVDEVLRRHARDNVSVIVIDVESPTDDTLDEETNPRIGVMRPEVAS